MFSYFPLILLFSTVSLYIFHFFFFWIFPSTDSHFYWLFANYIRTGEYFAPQPYFYRQPSTMEPPLYSVFLFFADSFPFSDVIIHFAQIASILAGAFFIYKIFSYYFSKRFSLFSSAVFLLVPGHFVYVSNLVAEPISVFYITLYLFILHLIINRGKTKLFSILMPYSAFISLHRYNLLTFFGLTVILYLFSKKKNRRGYFGILSGIFILLIWVVINNRMNGSWGMSNSEGKHLYNRILHFDRILPSQNHPAFVRFRELAGERTDYFKPWWFYEPDLIESTGSETAASKIMQDFAVAALFSNPLKYIVNTPGFFLFAHGENPTYSDPLYLYSGNMNKNCQMMGNIRFCRPIFQTDFAFEIWDRMVYFVDYFYLNIIKYINYLILLPSIVYLIIEKDKYFKTVSILYLLSILFFVLAEAPLPRYTYIFTPLTVMIVLFSLKRIYEKRFLRK